MYVFWSVFQLKELEGLPDKHRVEIEEHTQKIKSLEVRLMCLSFLDCVHNGVF